MAENIFVGTCHGLEGATCGGDLMKLRICRLKRSGSKAG